MGNTLVMVCNDTEKTFMAGELTASSIVGGYAEVPNIVHFDASVVKGSRCNASVVDAVQIYVRY